MSRRRSRRAGMSRLSRAHPAALTCGAALLTHLFRPCGLTRSAWKSTRNTPLLAPHMHMRHLISGEDPRLARTRRRGSSAPCPGRPNTSAMTVSVCGVRPLCLPASVNWPPSSVDVIGGPSVPSAASRWFGGWPVCPCCLADDLGGPWRLLASATSRAAAAVAGTPPPPPC